MAGQPGAGARLVPSEEWIDVRERLPEKDAEVLICLNASIDDHRYDEFQHEADRIRHDLRRAQHCCRHYAYRRVFER
jgi:hypothetical protein